MLLQTKFFKSSQSLCPLNPSNPPPLLTKVQYKLVVFFLLKTTARSHSKFKTK